MKSNSFWDWYQKHFKANISLASFLFLLQLFHLYWLLSDVVLVKLTGQSFFLFSEWWGRFSIFFDYTEIPALVTTSLVYIYSLRKRFSTKSLTYLVFLNVQWLHILWITDEFVVEHFYGHEFIIWSSFLAWFAILIDFLELPVIYDTVKTTLKEYRKK
jgi:hypothetical protein